MSLKSQLGLHVGHALRLRRFRWHGGFGSLQPYLQPSRAALSAWTRVNSRNAATAWWHCPGIIIIIIIKSTYTGHVVSVQRVCRVSSEVWSLGPCHCVASRASLSAADRWIGNSRRPSTSTIHSTSSHATHQLVGLVCRIIYLSIRL